MSLIPHRSSFTVPASIDDVRQLMDKIGEAIRSLPYLKIISETDKGLVCELNFRKRFSSLKDKMLVSIRREDENTISIIAIGSRIEYTIYVRSIPEDDRTSIEINAMARTEKTGLAKKLLEDFAQRLRSFIIENIGKKPVEEKRERKPTAKEERKEAVQPVLVPLSELRKEEAESVKARPAPITTVEEKKEEAEAKPSPTISIPSRNILEEKLKDPIWIAQLLMHSTLIKRKTITLPSSPKELLDLVESIAGEDLAKHPLIMISVRGGDIDSHIIYDPRDKDIKASKTTIGGILDYTGEEALKKLFEKKNTAVNVKIWGISKLPQS